MENVCHKQLTFLDLRIPHFIGRDCFSSLSCRCTWACDLKNTDEIHPPQGTKDATKQSPQRTLSGRVATAAVSPSSVRASESTVVSCARCELFSAQRQRLKHLHCTSCPAWFYVSFLETQISNLTLQSFLRFLSCLNKPKVLWLLLATRNPG